MTDSMSETADEQSHVLIKTTGPSTAKIHLNGEDVTPKIRGVQVNMTATEGHEVVLVLNARAGVEFDGYARVVVGEEPDPGPAAVAFLAAIDPEELEQAALNRLDLDTGEHGLTKTMIRQLTEWASGRS